MEFLFDIFVTKSQTVTSWNETWSNSGCDSWRHFEVNTHFFSHFHICNIQVSTTSYSFRDHLVILRNSHITVYSNYRLHVGKQLVIFYNNFPTSLTNIFTLQIYYSIIGHYLISQHVRLYKITKFHCCEANCKEVTMMTYSEDWARVTEV